MGKSHPLLRQDYREIELKVLGSPQCLQPHAFPQPQMEPRAEMEDRPGRKKGLVIEEGGSLSLW